MSTTAGGHGDGVDIFLNLKAKRAGKIKGEGRTQGHEEDIEVFGWSWGVVAGSALGSGESTARRNYRPLVIRKGVDSASVGLMSALVTNDEIKEANLSMRKAGSSALDYYTVTLSGARITDITLDVDATGRPTEQISLTFTKVEVEYKRQQGTGGSAGSFSFSDEVLPK